MERYLTLGLLVAALSVPVNSLSQSSYHPFLKEGKVWNYENIHVHVGADDIKRTVTAECAYVVSGDTVIGGVDYKKMFYSKGGVAKFRFALREENRRVWLHLGDNDGDLLVYDFGLQAGESYTTPRWDYNESDDMLELVLTRQMEFHGNDLRVFLYRELQGRHKAGQVHIVEGVGCENGWMLMNSFLEYPTYEGYSYDMQVFTSCYEGEECIFTRGDFNLVTGLHDVGIGAADSSSTSTLYDLQGRRLDGIPRRGGVYVRDGRKVVVR